MPREYEDDTRSRLIITTYHQTAHSLIVAPAKFTAIADTFHTIVLPQDRPPSCLVVAQSFSVRPRIFEISYCE